MYESPQPTRRFIEKTDRPRSLRTNFISKPKPSLNTDHPNWTYILMSILAMIIIIWCLAGSKQYGNHNKQQPINRKQPIDDSAKKFDSKSETTIASLKIEQLIMQNPKISVNKEQNQRIQQQALKQFVQDLEKKKKGLKTQFKDQQLNSFQRVNLTIVKHQKLTSVSVEYSQMLNSFFNILWSQNEPFTNIDRILNDQNNRIWRSKGNLLTIIGENHFSPKAFVIITNSPKKIFIFGLIIESTPFAANKQISKKALGTYYLKQGRNVIQCNYLECYQSYSMITFGMNEMQIKNLAAYSRKNKNQNENFDL